MPMTEFLLFPGKDSMRRQKPPKFGAFQRDWRPILGLTNEGTRVLDPLECAVLESRPEGMDIAKC